VKLIYTLTILMMLFGFVGVAKAEPGVAKAEPKVIIMCHCGIPVILYYSNGDSRLLTKLEDPTEKAYAVCQGKDHSAQRVDIEKISKKACPISL
jgi:hypothetical protein